MYSIWESVRPELTWTHYRILIAKYSSIYKDNNIFVSKYMTFMPTEEELKRVINEEKRKIEEYKFLNKK